LTEDPFDTKQRNAGHRGGSSPAGWRAVVPRGHPLRS